MEKPSRLATKLEGMVVHLRRIRQPARATVLYWGRSGKGKIMQRLRNLWGKR